AAGTVFYLIVSLQGSMQAQMAVNKTVHFTDWVVGHSHLAMLGFASFAAAGGIVHVWQRIGWARYNARLIDHAFWLLAAGVVVMVVDLTLAGLVQGRLWQSGAPWIESVQASRPYWMVRTLAAVPLAGGFMALLAGLTTGPRGGGLKAIEDTVGVEPVEEIAPRFAPMAGDVS
ncbi:MAG: putative cytochrome subunit protein, partial [Anaerolineales bacterium]|nr:putative cytochrome subunit protein [Anaerolineales bacterium]